MENGEIDFELLNSYWKDKKEMAIEQFSKYLQYIYPSAKIEWTGDGFKIEAKNPEFDFIVSEVNEILEYGKS